MTGSATGANFAWRVIEFIFDEVKIAQFCSIVAILGRGSIVYSDGTAIGIGVNCS